jgi:DNA repair exonuclease SbcCD ATPase subunit
MDEIKITTREEAYVIHNRIMANGKIVQTALIDMCKDLKEMRDRSLYSELGYDSFEDYAEQACGIRQRQAYSYISAYEKLGANYIEENSHLGITKLELISQISSYEREEFLQEVDVEDVSTRELKKQVEEFKNQTEQLTLELTSAKEKLEDAQDANDYALQQANEEIERLKSELENNKATEVVANVEVDDGMIKSAVDEAVKQAKEEDADLIKKLKAQVKEQKEKVKAVTDSKDEEIKKAKQQVSDTANKKIDELIAQQKATDEKLQQALKSAKVANADENIMAIRYLFSSLQSTAKEIKGYIDKVAEKDEQQAAKLTAGIKDVLTAIVNSL